MDDWQWDQACSRSHTAYPVVIEIGVETFQRS